MKNKNGKRKLDKPTLITILIAIFGVLLFIALEITLPNK
jgi:hypothetical protein